MTSLFESLKSLGYCYGKEFTQWCTNDMKETNWNGYG